MIFVSFLFIDILIKVDESSIHFNQSVKFVKCKYLSEFFYILRPVSFLSGDFFFVKG